MRIKAWGIGAALIALTTIVAAGSVAIAKSGSGVRELDRMERKLGRLELSAETEAAVFAILDEARPSHRALRARVRDERHELRSLLENDGVDEATIMERVDAIGALKTEARKQDLRTWLKVRAALSPEDREAFSAMRDRKRGHGNGHGRGHGDRRMRDQPRDTQ